MTLDDVVVDDYDEVLWRLRALYGLKNFVGQRMLALAVRWEMGRQRPRRGPHTLQAGHRADRVQGIGRPAGGDPVEWESRSSSPPGPIAIWLCRTHAGDEEGIRPAGVRRLHRVPAVDAGAQRPGHYGRLVHGDDLRRGEHRGLHALELAQRRGLHRLLRIGFRGMPPGILLHYIAGKPVFMHNSTFPHKATVTCAHCTAPRRMDGKQLRSRRGS